MGDMIPLLSLNSPNLTACRSPRSSVSPTRLTAVSTARFLPFSRDVASLSSAHLHFVQPQHEFFELVLGELFGIFSTHVLHTFVPLTSGQALVPPHPRTSHVVSRTHPCEFSYPRVLSFFLHERGTTCDVPRSFARHRRPSKLRNAHPRRAPTASRTRSGDVVNSTRVYRRPSQSHPFSHEDEGGSSIRIVKADRRSEAPRPGGTKRGMRRIRVGCVEVDPWNRIGCD